MNFMYNFMTISSRHYSPFFLLSLVSIISITFVTFPCFALDVLFIGTKHNGSDSEYQVQISCNIYGLNVDYYFIEDGLHSQHMTDAIVKTRPRALIFESDVLSTINKNELLKCMMALPNKSLPILITGVTPKTDDHLLQSWSGNAITGCRDSPAAHHSYLYVTKESRDVTGPLADQKTRIDMQCTDYFILNDINMSEEIMGISTLQEQMFPVLIKTMLNGSEVFFLTVTVPCRSSVISADKFIQDHILDILPVMIFLRRSCGEYCWHSSTSYANFTIDDPWLTEPYGHVRYYDLLTQMKKMNYHTTIAFIPWNYDRNSLNVIDLFKQNPDKYSLCIHGNNHDHYEFYKYSSASSNQWPPRPLEEQEADIKQALARMEKFHLLTDLPYDRVMVFPHGIAPEKTLGVLKKLNFISTVNSRKTPIGTNPPDNPVYYFSPVTLHYENFPSLRRYHAREADEFLIALNLFIGNPILLYAHHGFFQEGIDAFNETALIINKMHPSVIWEGLGYICRHWYLERLRDEGNYDVLAFFNDFIVENTHTAPALFYIQKEESFIPPIASVTVNGYPHEFDIAKNSIALVVSLQPGETKRIYIEYKNDLDLKAITVGKTNARIALLRTLSDLRDLYLARNIMGGKIIALYYEINHPAFLISISCIILAAIACFVIRHRSKISSRISSHDH